MNTGPVRKGVHCESLTTCWAVHARVRLIEERRFCRTKRPEVLSRGQTVLGDIGVLATPGCRDLFNTLVTPC